MTGEIDKIIDRFDESYSCETVEVSKNTGFKKFGSSGHLAVRSIFPGSCDGYIVIPASELATVGQALIKLAKENAKAA